MKRCLKKKRYIERRRTPVNKNTPDNCRGRRREHVRGVYRRLRRRAKTCQCTRRTYVARGKGKQWYTWTALETTARDSGLRQVVRAEKQNICKGISKGIVIRENFEPAELSKSFFEPLNQVTSRTNVASTSIEQNVVKNQLNAQLLLVAMLYTLQGFVILLAFAAREPL